MGITVAGVFGGPVLALFICGIFLPVTNWKGCAIGFILGSGMLQTTLSPLSSKKPIERRRCEIKRGVVVSFHQSQTAPVPYPMANLTLPEGSNDQ